MTERMHWLGMRSAVPLLVLLAAVLAPRGAGSPGDADAGRIAALIEQLGSDSKAARDDAFDALCALGEQARRSLQNAVGSKDPDVRDAARRLLLALEQGPAPLRPKADQDEWPGAAQELPQVPRLRPFRGDGRSPEEWQRELDAWNRDMQEWTRELDQWLDQRVHGGVHGFGVPFGPGFGESMQAFRQGIDGDASWRLNVDEDGRVEARVEREVDGERTEQTYEAESMEEFRRRYPEVAEQLGLDRGGLLGPWTLPFQGRHLQLPAPFEGFSRAPFQAFPMPQAPQADGPRLGVQVRVLPEDDPLRAHVALDPGIGLLIAEVIPGTLAERLDLRRHDILVKVGAEPVGDSADVAAALRDGDPEQVEVTVIRQGTEQVLRQDV